MKKKQYIAPKAEAFELPRLKSMLAHFSADATIIDDFEETAPEESDMLGPGY